MSAVIEFRLNETLGEADLGKLKDRFQKLKWKAEELIEVELKIGMTGGAIQRVVGFRFTSPEADKVIAIDRENYSLTVLPPYPGWEALLAAFNEHLPNWRKIVGRRPLKRIGVRYVNRFDVPCPPGEIINISDYMLFKTVEPDILDEAVRGLITQVNSGIVADKLLVNLSTAMVDSPIVDHVSLSLDIDIYREGVDVPQADADIDDFLGLVRQRRTEIFEKCITDEMRKLIA
jgi:uncharacterized protein (TIGR04255 family)